MPVAGALNAAAPSLHRQNRCATLHLRHKDAARSPLKQYQQVVQERYESSDAQAQARADLYSPLHRIGFLLQHRLREQLAEAARRMAMQGLDWKQAQVLDVGCGVGTWTQFWAAYTGDAARLYGVDLSQLRIDKARAINGSVHWQLGDVTQLPEALPIVDVATAIVVLMHLRSRAELLAALRQLHAKLRPGGWLLIYERTGADHFAASEGADHAAFLPSQIHGLCAEAGFVRAFELVVFRQICGLGHEAWLAGRAWPPWLRTLAMQLPGPPANMLFALRKPLEPG